MKAGLEEELSLLSGEEAGELARTILAGLGGSARGRAGELRNEDDRGPHTGGAEDDSHAGYIRELSPERLLDSERKNGFISEIEPVIAAAAERAVLSAAVRIMGSSEPYGHGSGGVRSSGGALEEGKSNDARAGASAGTGLMEKEEAARGGTQMSGTTALGYKEDMKGISDFFMRDSRRYDGEFERY